MPCFIVHEHRSRRPHYDFRLEREGVLRSWAVPKGIPEEPGVQRLAIQVGDHTLEFGDFEGTIPDGQYGAGEIEVWDSGTYVPQEWSERSIKVDLSGMRLRGAYHLVRFERKGSKEWLVQKVKQPNPGGPPSAPPLCRYQQTLQSGR